MGGFVGANNHDGTVAVTVDILTFALIICCILYSFCLVLAKRKLSMLNRLSSHLTTRKLLILSVALVSIVRIMTISGVAMMNIANVRAHYSLQPPRHHQHQTAGDKDQEFYDKSMAVLFDLPNVLVVSTYVLLTLVWAECFLESRLHTESAAQWKRSWLVYFMVFNTTLYATQITFYASIFLAPNRILRDVIYIGITGINFTAVLLVLISYVYLNIQFSGFPYRSQRSRMSLSRVSSVMTLWSITRVIWGVATLLVFIYDVELLQDSQTPFWSFAILLLLFFVCEILPILALLDYSYLNLVGLERVEHRMVDESSRSGNGTSIVRNNVVDDVEVSSIRAIRWQDQLNDPLLHHNHQQQQQEQERQQLTENANNDDIDESSVDTADYHRHQHHWLVDALNPFSYF